MPRRVEPAAHGVAILARDERLRPRLADVVEARPVLAADQQKVAKPLIGDEGDAAAAALDDGVCRSRHAVPDIGDIAPRPVLRGQGLPETPHRAEGAVLRGGRHLGDGHMPRGLVIGEVVGKGAADIRGDAQAGRGHAANPRRRGRPLPAGGSHGQ